MGAIIAIGGSKNVVSVDSASGRFGVEKHMTVNLTADHRHIYGADAAEFLQVCTCACCAFIVHNSMCMLALQTVLFVLFVLPVSHSTHRRSRRSSKTLSSSCFCERS